MVSDRGTLPRGAVADQQASWAEPTAPGGRRMPSAPRERKPALAAVAILLVALGGAAAGYLVLNAGHRVGAVEITQDVGQGQQIPASAIKEVQINADTDVRYVAWQFANRVTGVFARVQIPAGTLLTSNMTAATSNLTAGKVEIGLSLKPGQAPTNLLIGQTVRAFPVGTGSGCGGGANGTGGAGTGVAATPGEPITTGTIVSVSGSTATNGSTAAVTLAVPETDAGVLACYASAQDVAIALTPGSG
ncbi:MAG TPA: hypothetical protein VFV73_00060 [Streptosporangiaceae bacterium]|nr:hypothetical protein [Streptosporangiaceae bacterium]